MNRPDSRKRMLTPIRDEQGMALVIAILVGALLLLVGMGFMTVSLTESNIASNEVGDMRAFYLAEGGMQHAIKSLEFVDPTTILNGTESIFAGTGKGAGTDNKDLAQGNYTVQLTNNTAANGFPRGNIPVDPLDAAFAATEDSDRIIVLTSTGSIGNVQESIEVVAQLFSFPMVPGAIVQVSRPDGGNNEFDFEDTSLVNGADESGTCQDQPAFVNSSEHLNFDAEGGILEGSFTGNEYGEDVPWRHFDSTKDDPIYNDPEALNTLVEEWMNLPETVTITGPPSGDPVELGTADNPQITVLNIGAGNQGESGAHNCTAEEIDPQPCLTLKEGSPDVTGYGILIVTGELFIDNNFEWHGLIVQKTKKQFTLGDPATSSTQSVHGAIIAVDNTDPLGCCDGDEDDEEAERYEDTKVDIQSSSQVLFNCEALNKYARPVTAGTSGTGDAPVNVLSWRRL